MPRRALRPVVQRAVLLLLVSLVLLTVPAVPAQTGPTLLAKNYVFEPQRLEVDPGATITVTVTGEGHTVTSVEAGLFDTGLKQGGETATFVAPTKPGEYKFYCQLHANPTDPVDAQHMTGVLVVRAAGTGSPSTPASSTPAGSTPVSSTVASSTLVSSTPASSTAASSTPPSATPTHADPGFEVVALAAAVAVGALVLARRR